MLLMADTVDSPGALFAKFFDDTYWWWARYGNTVQYDRWMHLGLVFDTTSSKTVLYCNCYTEALFFPHRVNILGK